MGTGTARKVSGIQAWARVLDEGGRGASALPRLLVCQTNFSLSASCLHDHRWKRVCGTVTVPCLLLSGGDAVQAGKPYRGAGSVLRVGRGARSGTCFGRRRERVEVLSSSRLLTLGLDGLAPRGEDGLINARARA